MSHLPNKKIFTWGSILPMSEILVVRLPISNPKPNVAALKPLALKHPDPGFRSLQSSVQGNLMNKDGITTAGVIKIQSCEVKFDAYRSASYLQIEPLACVTLDKVLSHRKTCAEIF